MDFVCQNVPTPSNQITQRHTQNTHKNEDGFTNKHTHTTFTHISVVTRYTVMLSNLEFGFTSAVTNTQVDVVCLAVAELGHDAVLVSTLDVHFKRRVHEFALSAEDVGVVWVRNLTRMGKVISVVT